MNKRIKTLVSSLVPEEMEFSSAYSHIEQYEDEIKAGRTIAVIWTISDVQQQARVDGIELSDEQAIAVLQKIKRRHDADVGINWDIIRIHIDSYLSELKIMPGIHYPA